MEPTKTPWRVLDAPTSAVPSAATPSEPPAEHGLVLSSTTIKAVGAGTGVVACAIVAFALAIAGGSGDAVLVDGGSHLPLTSDAAPASSGGPAAIGGGEVVVEIVGAVLRPGVFRLPPGARVGDLVAAAGGYGPRVDTVTAERTLNLAATLHDGDQVRIPARDDPSGPAAAGAGPLPTGDTNGPLDLNRATAAELDALPGVGPVTAEKILAARAEAPFATVQDLRTRGLVGEKTFESLRELVTVP